jgi:rhodanese-related sulfurtransferase
MKSVIFDIHISSDEWLKIYRGEAREVVAVCREGKRVRFPAAILQKYVTHFGVSGSFEVGFDESGKFQSIVKLN